MQEIAAYASHWTVQAFLIVFGALLIDFFQRRLLKRILRKLEVGTRTLWDDAVVGAVRPPLSLLIWVLGIGFAAELAGGARARRSMAQCRPCASWA